jgi:peroxiredoxin
VDDVERAVPGYMERMGLTFPGLLDSKKKVARLYGFWSTPTTFFVNREGMMIGSRIGGRNWGSEQADEFMEWFLKQ